MSTPCYNEETHTDCPKRHAGCAANCPDWDKYVAERDKEYERRAEKTHVTEMLHDPLAKRADRNRKYVIRNRPYKRH